MLGPLAGRQCGQGASSNSISLVGCGAAIVKRHAAREAVVVANVSLALAASPAAASFPGANGRIAYGVWAAPGGVGHEIHTVRPDGSADRLILADPAGNPEWSPDGQRLAFDRPYESGVWIAGADGDAAIEVVARAPEWYTADYPTWAPDGERLAFSVQWDRRREPSILFADAQGWQQTFRVGWQPEWSPDGTSVAFVRWHATRSYSYSLKIAKLDGTTRTIGHDLGFLRSLDFSPDGHHVLFRETREKVDGNWASERLARINVQSGRIRTLLVSRRLRSGMPLAGAWSPDGKKIAFLWQPKFNPQRASVPGTEVWTMRPDGSHRRRRHSLPRLTWAESIDWQPRPVTPAARSDVARPLVQHAVRDVPDGLFAAARQPGAR